MSVEAKKKVLITGATGFIGQYLVEQAIENNYEVFIALRKESDTARIKHLTFKEILVDFSSEKTIEQAFNFDISFDTVVHNAGVKACLNKDQYYLYNKVLTKNLCKVLYKKKLLKGKFIYVSSLAALGPGDNQSFQDIVETKIAKPISHYGKSKLLTEKVVLNSGLNSLILRPTAVYGKGGTDYKGLIKVVKKGFAFYMTKPSQLLSFVHAEDVAKIVFLADRKKSNTTIFNVSDGKDYTLASFYNIFAESLGVEIRYRIKIPFFLLISVAIINQSLEKLFKIKSALNSVEKAKEITALNWRCSANKLKTELGFKASHSLKEIID